MLLDLNFFCDQIGLQFFDSRRLDRSDGLDHLLSLLDVVSLTRANLGDRFVEFVVEELADLDCKWSFKVGLSLVYEFDLQEVLHLGSEIFFRGLYSFLGRLYESFEQLCLAYFDVIELIFDVSVSNFESFDLILSHVQTFADLMLAWHRELFDLSFTLDCRQDVQRHSQLALEVFQRHTGASFDRNRLHDVLLRQLKSGKILEDHVRNLFLLWLIVC